MIHERATGLGLTGRDAAEGGARASLPRYGMGFGDRDRRLIAAAVLAYALIAALANYVMADGGVAPVGLEARGVDPWHAWRSGGRLDVRDELNRPVSPALVERQLKGAWRQAVTEVASVSGLPAAAAVLAALERLAETAASMGRRLARPGLPRASLSLPPEGRAGPRPGLFMLAAPWLALAIGLRAAGSSAARAPAFAFPVPLRC